MPVCRDVDGNIQAIMACPTASRWVHQDMDTKNKKLVGYLAGQSACSATLEVEEYCDDLSGQHNRVKRETSREAKEGGPR